MRQQVKAELPSLRKVTCEPVWCTPELVALVEGTLAKDPDHRFPNARAMISALDMAFASLDR